MIGPIELGQMIGPNRFGPIMIEKNLIKSLFENQISRLLRFLHYSCHRGPCLRSVFLPPLWIA